MILWDICLDFVYLEMKCELVMVPLLRLQFRSRDLNLDGISRNRK